MKIWVISLSIMLASCSSSDFSSGSANRGPSTDNASPAPDTPPSIVEEGENGRVKETFEGQLTVLSLVDIVFAVDTSGSMLTEKSYLEKNMKKFLDQFLAKSQNIDFHIYMFGGNFNFPEMNHEKITLIQETVGSKNALAVLQKFFKGEVTNPKPIRAESKKQIVVISDDNASGVKGTDFKSFIATTPALAGKTSLNGFVGLKKGTINSWCKIDNVGSEYIQLGSDPQVGGFIQDLCIEDWSSLLDNLASKIITSVAKLEFPLKQALQDASIEVVVGDTKLPQTAFTYNAEKNSIVIANEFAPKDKENIVITYLPK